MKKRASHTTCEDIAESSWLQNGLRLSVAIVLTVSVVSKVASPRVSADLLGQYLSLSESWIWILLFFVVVVETMIAITYWRRRPAAQLIYADGASLLLFSVFLGVGLFRLVTRAPGGCGCLGSISWMDSGWPEIVRDVALLSMAGWLIIIQRDHKVGRLTLQLMLPLIAVTNLGVAALGGYLTTITKDVETPAPFDWYGFIPGMEHRNLAWALERPEEVSVLRQIKSAPLWRVQNTQVGNTHDGWVVDEIVPVMDKVGGLLHFTVLIDQKLRINKVLVRPLMGSTVIRDSRSRETSDLISTIIKKSQDGSLFIPYDKNLLGMKSPRNIDIIIIDLVNNAINQILMKHRSE